jgi:hypothetical protein
MRAGKALVHVMPELADMLMASRRPASRPRAHQTREQPSGEQEHPRHENGADRLDPQEQREQSQPDQQFRNDLEQVSAHLGEGLALLEDVRDLGRVSLQVKRPRLGHDGRKQPPADVRLDGPRVSRLPEGDAQHAGRLHRVDQDEGEQHADEHPGRRHVTQTRDHAADHGGQGRGVARHDRQDGHDQADAEHLHGRGRQHERQHEEGPPALLGQQDRPDLSHEAHGDGGPAGRIPTT